MHSHRWLHLFESWCLNIPAREILSQSDVYEAISMDVSLVRMLMTVGSGVCDHRDSAKTQMKLCALSRGEPV